MSLPLPAGDWAFDTMHSQVGFAVRHLGISTVRGLFTDYSGSVTIGDDLASSAVKLSAKIGSLSTGNGFRDGHLQNADILDGEAFPEMSFASTSIAEGGSGYVLTGDLTIKDVTKSVAFDVAFHGTGVFPMDQSTHAGFLATGSINRSEFNAGYGVPMVSDAVQLSIDVQLVAPKA